MKFSMRALLVLSVFLTVKGAWADETGFVNARLIGGIGLGGAAATSGFSSAYNGTGGGIDGYLGYEVDPNLAFVLSADSFLFNTNVSGTYSQEINLALSVKYAFGDGPVHFYLIGGLGENDTLTYVQSNDVTALLEQRSFIIEPGAGVQFFLNNALNLYVQAKFVNVFANPEFSYIPITVGLDFK